MQPSDRRVLALFSAEGAGLHRIYALASSMFLIMEGGWHRMRQILFILASLAAVSVGSASAQTMPACNGDIAIVRVSQIKPTSSLAAFMKAQEAHIAWYRKNGFTDNQIYSSPVIVTDPKTKTSKYSDTEIIAFHVRPPSGVNGASVASKDQASWDAYVKLYRDSSDIKSDYIVCLPKNH
jgi:hypothetical protein